MSAIVQTHINTPTGQLLIATRDQCVQSVSFNMTDLSVVSHVSSDVADQTIQQLNTYFQQAHNDWSVPLLTKGTEFQRKVWRYLQTIPVGETRTYSEVAKELATSARAVGNACRANLFAIIVPCHRVISSSGLGGYYGKTAGRELVIKQWLLDHEQYG